MSSLRTIFDEQLTFKSDKWSNYFLVYERYLGRFRDNVIPRHISQRTLIEIGVQGGGSLEMWSKYFGTGVKIIGIDIDPDCAALNVPGAEIYIGDQTNTDFLDRVIFDHGKFDIVIDDGG